MSYGNITVAVKM